MAPRIRSMHPADVEPATMAIRRDEWGDRRAWFELATTFPGCHALVADLDDRIVGTGVGTRNGTVGWIGTIWVARDVRGRGLGRALTEAVISALVDGGVRSLVLVASPEGRRLYERMGFEVETWYDTHEAPGLGDEAAMPPAVRPFRRSDLPSMQALDAEATGEDRSAVLARFASPTTARAVIQSAELASPGGSAELAWPGGSAEPDGVAGLGGFVVRAPWGGAATVAPRPDDAVRLITARRAAAPTERRVRASVLRENEAGREALRRAGFEPAWSAPRMVRGQPVRWRPDWVWGQFNFAMG